MSNELAQRPKNEIRAFLEGNSLKDQVARVLPTHLKPERFIRVSITATTRNPKLLECTPASFFKCLLDLSALGLEPDGRRAHLIPYGKECTLIIDWKGLAELAMRSGIVSVLHADVVCENDVFDYDRGELKTHKVDYRKDRGAIYAVYALCKFKDGNEKCDVMSIAEVNAIRKRSRSGNNGPWVTDFNEMAKKTVFRRLSKWLPLSAEFRDALDTESDPIDITPEKMVATIGTVKPRGELPTIDITPDPEPEPEQQEHPKEPAKEQQAPETPEPQQEAPAAAEGAFPDDAPEDEDQLRDWLRREIVNRDIEEAFAVGKAAAAKKANAGCTRLSRVQLPGLRWIASNLDQIVKEAGQQ